jgi:deoxyribose-phosphate aldolase
MALQDEFTPAQLAKYIDHTLLKPDAQPTDIEKLCAEALQHQLFGICVNSSYLPLATSLLQKSTVTTVAVIGFPLGAASSYAKAKEAEWCVKQGAREIDMVIHLGWLKAGLQSEVCADIREVVNASQGALVKVIIETALLSDDQKRVACALSVDAGAQFVKTCTGFSGGGATKEDIALMRSVVGPNLGVKASGGVKTFTQAVDLIRAGATRIGTSNGVQLVTGKNISGGY